MVSDNTINNVEKFVKLYAVHRAKIWGTVFLIVGLFGGNVDRISKYIIGVDKTESNVIVKDIQDKLNNIEEKLEGLKNE